MEDGCTVNHPLMCPKEPCSYFKKEVFDSSPLWLDKSNLVSCK